MHCHWPASARLLGASFISPTVESVPETLLAPAGNVGCYHRHVALPLRRPDPATLSSPIKYHDERAVYLSKSITAAVYLSISRYITADILGGPTSRQPPIRTALHSSRQKQELSDELPACSEDRMLGSVAGTLGPCASRCRGP
jgi:hypothetical protein